MEQKQLGFFLLDMLQHVFYILWELILEEDMCRLLKESDSPEEWLNKMAEIVKHNGEGKNMDNYSAIAVWNTK